MRSQSIPDYTTMSIDSLSNYFGRVIEGHGSSIADAVSAIGESTTVIPEVMQAATRSLTMRQAQVVDINILAQEAGKIIAGAVKGAFGKSSPQGVQLAITLAGKLKDYVESAQGKDAVFGYLKQARKDLEKTATDIIFSYIGAIMLPSLGQKAQQELSKLAEGDNVSGIQLSNFIIQNSEGIYPNFDLFARTFIGENLRGLDANEFIASFKILSVPAEQLKICYKRALEAKEEALKKRAALRGAPLAKGAAPAKTPATPTKGAPQTPTPKPLAAPPAPSAKAAPKPLAAPPTQVPSKAATPEPPAAPPPPPRAVVAALQGYSNAKHIGDVESRHVFFENATLEQKINAAGFNGETILTAIQKFISEGSGSNYVPLRDGSSLFFIKGSNGEIIIAGISTAAAMPRAAATSADKPVIIKLGGGISLDITRAGSDYRQFIEGSEEIKSYFAKYPSESADSEIGFISGGKVVWLKYEGSWESARYKITDFCIEDASSGTATISEEVRAEAEALRKKRAISAQDFGKFISKLKEIPGITFEEQRGGSSHAKMRYVDKMGKPTSVPYWHIHTSSGDANKWAKGVKDVLEAVACGMAVSPSPQSSAKSPSEQPPSAKPPPRAAPPPQARPQAPLPAQVVPVRQLFLEAHGRYSDDFKESTGLDVRAHGRMVVNMSPDRHLCGYRAILSQIDPNYAGTVLATVTEGGVSDKVNGDIDGIDRLYSTVNESAISLNYAENDLTDEGIQRIARSIARPIAVVSDGTFYEGGFQREGIPSFAMYDDNGVTVWAFGESQQQNAQTTLIGALENQNAIVLYYVNGNHYRSVQRIENLPQTPGLPAPVRTQSPPPAAQPQAQTPAPALQGSGRPPPVPAAQPGVPIPQQVSFKQATSAIENLRGLLNGFLKGTRTLDEIKSFGELNLNQFRFTGDPNQPKFPLDPITEINTRLGKIAGERFNEYSEKIKDPTIETTIKYLDSLKEALIATQRIDELKGELGGLGTSLNDLKNLDSDASDERRIRASRTIEERVGLLEQALSKAKQDGYISEGLTREINYMITQIRYLPYLLQHPEIPGDRKAYNEEMGKNIEDIVGKLP